MKNYWLTQEEERYKVQYKVIEADVPNKNNRVYPKELLERVVREFDGSLGTQLGHLGNCDDTIIHLDKVSHKITSLELRGNELYAGIVPLNTPQGKVLQEMLNRDEIAFRLSGVGGGKVDDNGNFVIGDSYRFICVNALCKEEAS